MSNDPKHRSDDQWLNSSFDKWDVGEPSGALWEQIEESIAVDAVWERVNGSLQQEEHAPDRWIAAAHENWNPGEAHDGWSKLNDAISLEQVWTGLDQSLNQPVATRMPIWKLMAASVTAIFLSGHFSDAPAIRHEVQYSPELAFVQPQTTTSDGTVNTNYEFIVADNQSIVSYSNTAEVPVNQERFQQDNPENGTQLVQQQIQTPPNPKVVPSPTIPQEKVKTDDILADLGNPNLTVLPSDWQLDPEQLGPRKFDIKPPFHHWTVQVGTQLSILQERNQAMYTSTFPKLGLAADLSYRHRLGSFQFIHAIGLSQYSQEAGKYLNGRYATTNQRINALQFSSSIGYNYKRFTVYGGLLVSKALNGLEHNNNAITQVYNFDEVQVGFTSGIDFRIASFPNSGKHISIGSQYQWLPSYSGSKASFENIQGIRFQTKFSF
ncbi:MAG: hypothetical protein A3D31_16605 [Candidatus Fluviicola riflensis]|nr:MAG: hypothetical protein CHH17_01545 [Candidatus Fluviicola riflensis]OGS76617.1 MAG: hypothetical protein A3D31_16605 [Candidatus Fluviicola riflensis]OGS83028.1 MAG: hypothetical protein A2724_14755 [Fluviicola sp. RIFCSPHIGHO2_01_FULL_43_53]OGS88348.1 MAG: hypothetical protein A3E30_06110 [Fluviicola sp. RIFCSPHIGHO2_12_FULL_43_24]